MMNASPEDREIAIDQMAAVLLKNPSGKSSAAPAVSPDRAAQFKVLR